MVARCHSLGIVHRDLKLSNFMLAEPGDIGSVRAIDFGSAVFCQPGEVLTAMAGSPMYVAPEVLEEKYGPPCDVWSAGVMMYTLLAGHPPFRGGEGQPEGVLNPEVRLRTEQSWCFL